MKVIICGAGQVGYGIAERLAAEGNDVSVIDTSQELVQRVNDMLDARGVLGHGSYPSVLQDAGARDADMLIAVTLYDEVNMVACQVAQSLFDIPTKIARVRAQEYLDPAWQSFFSNQNMPVDVTISPEIEVGEMVMRRLRQPGAFETVSFADDQAVLVGISCDEDCPIVDTPLKQLRELFPDLPAMVVAARRGDRLFVPSSDDQLLVEDDAYVICQADQVVRTLKIFGHEEQSARRILIAGGGNIGLYVARQLEQSDSSVRVKVLEMDRDRAVKIAEQLGRTVVLHGSALNEDLLREADVVTADVIVALTNDDQVNVLTSVLAKQLGCERSLCLVNTAGYANIVRSLGIDAQLNPRAVTVSRVLQHVRRGRIRGVHSVQNGEGEVIELESLSTAPVLGKKLRDLGLPDGVRFGAILRNGELIIPDGDTEIEASDRVVVFALASRVRDVEALFRVGLDFF